jgi:hypothetical protein
MFDGVIRHDTTPVDYPDIHERRKKYIPKNL